MTAILGPVLVAVAVLVVFGVLLFLALWGKDGP